MTAIADFLAGIPATWKALAAIAGALGVGVGVGVAIVGFTSLPSDVAAMEAAVVENTAYRVRHQREFRALVCLLTLPDTVDTRDQLRECGL